MIHVLPINDMEEHEESTTCKCQPSVRIENGETIVIHSSFDGRELIEEVYGILEIRDRVQYDLIKNKCPKAFSDLKMEYDDESYWLFLNPGYNGYLNYYESRDYGVVSNKVWEERNLYDFFDKRGFAPIITSKDKISWRYIFFRGNDFFECPHDYSDRRDAEAALFTNLFYELENLLTQKV